MKKILAIILCIGILLSLVGCHQGKKENNTLDIVTSFYPIYIATANIIDGVEGVTLTNLTSTEVGCLHDYQLTTANLMVLENSDILIVNGSDMESFIQKAIDNCENLEIVDSSENILLNHTEEQDNHDHGENAHIWVSISLYQQQVQNICDGLVKLDEENSVKYQENTKQYLEKLQELQEEMHAQLDDIKEKDIVTFHEAFDFFAEEFGLHIVSVIEREPGTYPSAGELADIIDTVRTTKAKAIFVEPQYAKTAADTIARETKIPVYTLDPVVTGDLEKDAYEKIMRKNLETLVQALGE